MMNRPGLRITAVLAGFLLVLMACNLTDSAPPPTVPPRATSTPPPTLGFATLAPDEFPAFVTPQATISRLRVVGSIV